MSEKTTRKGRSVKTGNGTGSAAKTPRSRKVGSTVAGIKTGPSKSARPAAPVKVAAPAAAVATPAPTPVAPPAPRPAADVSANVSLYEALGSTSGVESVVKAFCRKVLGDPRLSFYLFGLNQAELAAKLKAQVSGLLGGPLGAAEDDLCREWAHLRSIGLKHRHLELVMGHASDALQELQVKVEPATRIIGLLEAELKKALVRV